MSSMHNVLGHFGKVFMGQLQVADRLAMKTVAVKTLKG